jgi:ribulose-phosphate 3-epimerase
MTGSLPSGKIWPSLFGCETSELQLIVESLVRQGADVFHVDLIDATWPEYGRAQSGDWETAAETLQRHTVQMHAHLLSREPSALLPLALAAGAGLISVHAEADGDLQIAVKAIRDANRGVGLAFDRGTLNLDLVSELRPDFIHLLSAPLGGAFQEIVIDRSKEIREAGLNVPVILDGGINIRNADRCFQSGASALVVGSGITRQADPAQAHSALQRLGRSAR